MTTKTTEARRAKFEEWAKQKGWRVARRSDPQSTDEYMAYETQQRWECWNAALDSLCVELPFMRNYYGPSCEPEMAYAPEDIEEALTAAGVPYK